MAEEFNRLATDALVRIEDEVQAESYTGLYWRCALGTDHGSVVNDPHDLKRQVDDAIYSYRVTTNGKMPFERWWKGFEASGVKPPFGVQVAKAGGGHSVMCSSLIVPVSKIPVIQSLRFQIAENGIVGPVPDQQSVPEIRSRRGTTVESVLPQKNAVEQPGGGAALAARARTGNQRIGLAVV